MKKPLYQNLTATKAEDSFIVPFAQIDHRLTRSRHLSGKAKIVYVYIYGMKTGWKFSAGRMAEHFKESPDWIRSGINELITLGLISKKRNLNGTIEYSVRPFEESALPDELLS